MLFPAELSVYLKLATLSIKWDEIHFGVEYDEVFYWEKTRGIKYGNDQIDNNE